MNLFSSLRLVIFVSCLLVAVAQTRAEKTAHSAPNILFIAVDDLRPELGSYGTKTLTPNVDQFAKTGVQFERAYCQQSVCGASRLSIMSGLYPTRSNEHTFNVTDWRKRHPDLLTLNQHFVASGYNTIGFGKIYHHTKGVEVDAENWTQWLDLDRDDLYALPENKAGMDAYRKATAAGDKWAIRGPLTEIADVPNDAYIDGKRAAEATKILKRLGELQASEDGEVKPFFLAIGFTKPHLPFAVPKKYWDLYQRDDFKMPSNAAIPPGYLKAAAQLSAIEFKKYEGYGDSGPPDFSDELNKQLLHGYAASTSYADENVGIVLKALEANGLEENTIVVFWGDHGWKLGDHSSWGKQTNFECDTRVPLIVRVPGQLANYTTNSLVELIDLYPTLCELAKIKTPQHCQGKSFASLLKNKSVQHRDCAYSVYPTVEKQMGHSIRFGNYRYTEWRKNKGGAQAIGGVLTNLKNDPGEVTNLSQDKTHAEILKQGTILLDQRIQEAVSENSKQQAKANLASHSAYSITQGPAKQKGEPLLECDHVVGWRVTAVGTIVDNEGHVWTTPAEVAYSTGPKATDLFNECNDVELPNAEALDLSSVPVTDVDSDGEVFTTYFFGDNYAEIYINDKLIGVDPVPYWPFNVAVVRYRVKRPFVIGAKLVDWEENLNLGSEVMRGVAYHNGDGGFTAVTKNANGEVVDLTDKSWRVQLFYCSPILDPSSIVDTDAASGTKRNSLGCTSPKKAEAENGYAVRWPLPKNWGAIDFDDSLWSQASVFTNEQIGGSLSRPAYANFSTLFDDPKNDAQFIWSSNLLLDNLVLVRKVIQ